MDRRLLGIYLNDHLAGAAGGRELARRALRNNRGTAYEADLARLAGEIEEDRAALELVMKRLRIARSAVKPQVAWALEKIGRLKPNGRLLEYSPLSRVVELELLAAGVETKRAMWVSLRALEQDDLGVDVEGLIARARRQRRMIERRRVQAVAEVFGSP